MALSPAIPVVHKILTLFLLSRMNACECLNMHENKYNCLELFRMSQKEMVPN